MIQKHTAGAGKTAEIPTKTTIEMKHHLIQQYLRERYLQLFSSTKLTMRTELRM